MKWINWILYLSALVVLFACATTRRYDEVLSGWLGQERDTLIEQWGPPASSHAYPDGNLAYEYLSVDGDHDPEHPSRGLTGIQIGCKTVIVIDPSDVIVGWRRDGYNCRAR
jgi:hypothetical protein